MQTAGFHTLRNGALALALLAAAALLPQAATAGSLQDRGDFGGTWTYIGPSDHYHWRYADAYFDDGPPVLVAPPYVEGPPVYDPGYYGPPDYQDDAPGLTVVTPDVGIAVGID